MTSFTPPNLEGVPRCVVDTETTGVDWKRDHVVGYVVSPDPATSWYYPVRHGGGDNLPVEAVESWLRQLLARPDLHIINHSIKFDLHMLANHGIAVKGTTECLGVNAALIDENQKTYNLDFLSSLYPGARRKNATLYQYLADKFGGRAERKDQIARFHQLSGSDPRAVEYATGDGYTTWDVHDAQQKDLDDQLLRGVWDVECEVIKVLFKMERRGVRVDESTLHHIRGRILRKLREAEKMLPQNFNVRSVPQIADYLASRGVDRAAFPQTGTGRDSFRAPWLASIPQGEPIIRVRQLSNLLNTFIDPLIARHVWNGRVHTNYNQMATDDYGTITGRLSSDHPNMQQVPKRNKELAVLYRQLFLPEDGHQWSMNDFNQQEYRLFADYTNAPLLVQGYTADPPMDVHTIVAKLCEIERDPAKTVNFGILYWIGVPKLSAMLGRDAQPIMDEYHRMIPEAKQFLYTAQRLARDRGWVRTKLGRRGHFPDARFAYKAGNRVIQGSAADCTKLKMVEIDRLFDGTECGLMLQVHDELNWTVPVDAAHLDKDARRIMEGFGPEDRIPLKVPMPVESHMAENWGRASFPNLDWEGINAE